MRREITIYLKSKKTKRTVLVVVGFLLVFILINGFFIYKYNPYNYYFNFVKSIIPYPAISVGNRIITVKDLNELVGINKRIYENAYRVDFSKSKEGVKNLQSLRQQTRDEIVDNVIMEDILKEINKNIKNQEVRSEYKKLMNSMGSDKDIELVLKYSSNIKESDILKKIYIKMLNDRIRENVIYNLKMEVLVVKPENKEDQADWDIALEKAKKINEDLKLEPKKIEEYKLIYEDRQDYIVQNFGRDFYFMEDLPSEFQEKFKDFKKGVISDPLKGESGYYIFKVGEERGYYRGSLEEFLKEQREKLKIKYFIL